MKDKKKLNVKNMKETYLNARKQMNEVWDAFRMMYNMGFITYTEWSDFFNECSGWVYDETLDAVVQFGTDETIKKFEE